MSNQIIAASPITTASTSVNNSINEANAREHIDLKEFFEKNFKEVTNLKGDDQNSEQQRFAQNVINQLITQPRKEWSPYINGWYYVNMVSGTWVEKALNHLDKLTEFSPGFAKTLYDFRTKSGHLIKDIDPPENLAEYEAISGRTKNINIATKVMPMGEFSLDWKETSKLTVYKYHESWVKYIEADKKGFIPHTDDQDEFFIDIPYYNAIWITIFKPFTFEIQGLVKLLGVSPTNLPLKSVVGKRADNQLAAYSINYKVTDIITQFYQGSPQGNLYQDFIRDQENFFNLERVYNTGTEENTNTSGTLLQSLPENSPIVKKLRAQQQANKINNQSTSSSVDTTTPTTPTTPTNPTNPNLPDGYIDYKNTPEYKAFLESDAYKAELASIEKARKEAAEAEQTAKETEEAAVEETEVKIEDIKSESEKLESVDVKQNGSSIPDNLTYGNYTGAKINLGSDFKPIQSQDESFGVYYNQDYNTKLFNEHQSFEAQVESPIPAPVSGDVVYVKPNAGLLDSTVIIKGNDGNHYIYSKLELAAVNVGAKVNAGDGIGVAKKYNLSIRTKDQKWIDPNTAI